MITRSTAPWQWQIFASTSNGDPYSQSISTWVVVQSAASTKLLVLAPGETSQEGDFSSSGKQGVPTNPFSVGTTYYVQVRAVDNYYNIVTTTNPVITLTSDDPNT